MTTELQITTYDFNSTPVESVIIDNEPRLTDKAIGMALGYANPAKAIQVIIDRNQDLLAGLSVTLSLRATDGKTYMTRVWDERGVYLITMKARTKLADEFCRWAAEVLYAVRRQAPLPGATVPAELSATYASLPAELQAVVGTYAQRQLAKYLRLLDQAERELPKVPGAKALSAPATPVAAAAPDFLADAKALGLTGRYASAYAAARCQQATGVDLGMCAPEMYLPAPRKPSKLKRGDLVVLHGDVDDSVVRFVAACLNLDSDQNIRTREVSDRYRAWCETQEITEPLSIAALSNALKKLGLTKRLIGRDRAKHWARVSLKP